MQNLTLGCLTEAPTANLEQQDKRSVLLRAMNKMQKSFPESGKISHEGGIAQHSLDWTTGTRLC